MKHLTNDLSFPEYFWKLYKEEISTDLIIRAERNNLFKYLDYPAGNIIDIGCGQSPFLLSLLSSQYELYAIDTENYQIDFLKQRVKEARYPEKRINYAIGKFPHASQNDVKFHAANLNQLLHHLSTLEEAKNLSHSLTEQLVQGAIVSLSVYSVNSKIETIPRLYSKDDIKEVFPENFFQYIEIQEKPLEMKNKLKKLRFKAFKEYYGYSDEQIYSYLKSENIFTINCVLKLK